MLLGQAYLWLCPSVHIFFPWTWHQVWRVPSHLPIHLPLAASVSNLSVYLSSKIPTLIYPLYEIPSRSMIALNMWTLARISPRSSTIAWGLRQHSWRYPIRTNQCVVVHTTNYCLDTTRNWQHHIHSHVSNPTDPSGQPWRLQEEGGCWCWCDKQPCQSSEPFLYLFFLLISILFLVRQGVDNLWDLLDQVWLIHYFSGCKS